MKGGLRPPYLYGQKQAAVGSSATVRQAEAVAAAAVAHHTEAPESVAPGHTSEDSAGASPAGADHLLSELPEQGAAMPQWSVEDRDSDEAPPPPAPSAEFPLDAFFVPTDSHSVPAGYGEEHGPVAERVAARLEDMAGAVRTQGLAALGGTGATDELTRLIAAVVAGYLARE
jgi:hypothetical protein